MTVTVILQLFSLLIQVGSTSFPQEVDDLQFRTDAPSSWMKLREKVSNLEGTVTYERYKVPKTESAAPDISKLKFRFDGWSFVNESVVEDGATVFGRNPKYCFRLVESASKSGKWMLNRLGNGDAPDMTTVAEEIGFLRLYKASWSVLSFDLSDIIVNDTIKTRFLRYVPESNLAEIAIDSDSPVLKLDAKLKPISLHGKVMLDPMRDWHVVSYDIKLESLIVQNKSRFDIVGHGEVAYGDIKGIEIPIRVVQWKTDKSGIGEETVIVASDINSRKFGLSEFQLTAYGIKEPTGSNQQSNWIFPLVLASICGLGVFCWALWRRKSVD